MNFRNWWWVKKDSPVLKRLKNLAEVAIFFRMKNTQEGRLGSSPGNVSAMRKNVNGS